MYHNVSIQHMVIMPRAALKIVSGTQRAWHGLMPMPASRTIELIRGACTNWVTRATVDRHQLCKLSSVCDVMNMCGMHGEIKASSSQLALPANDWSLITLPQPSTVRLQAPLVMQSCTCHTCMVTVYHRYCLKFQEKCMPWAHTPHKMLWLQASSVLCHGYLSAQCNAMATCQLNVMQLTEQTLITKGVTNCQ